MLGLEVGCGRDFFRHGVEDIEWRISTGTAFLRAIERLLDGVGYRALHGKHAFQSSVIAGDKIHGNVDWGVVAELWRDPLKGLNSWARQLDEAGVPRLVKIEITELGLRNPLVIKGNVIFLGAPTRAPASVAGAPPQPPSEEEDKSGIWQGVKRGHLIAGMIAAIVTTTQVLSSIDEAESKRTGDFPVVRLEIVVKEQEAATLARKADIETRRLDWRRAFGNGLSAREVMAVQEALLRLGFDVGDIDGVWGKRTQRAAEAFARIAGLSGIVEKGNLMLIEMLANAIAEKETPYLMTGPPALKLHY